VRLSDARAQEVLERLEGWCRAAAWRLDPKPRLGSHSGAVMLWQRGQFVDAEIKASLDVDLGAVTADSAASLEAPRPALSDSGELPRLAHELRCTWLVVAPTLASMAKERRRPAEGKDQPATAYEPPVFREPSGRLVVAVRSPDELEQARAVLAEVEAATIVLAEGASR
jgi:cardiolipin synthase